MFELTVKLGNDLNKWEHTWSVPKVMRMIFCTAQKGQKREWWSRQVEGEHRYTV